MDSRLSRQAAEERFGELFEHLGLVTAYARRRGGTDPEAIAAEVMAIAWRKLPVVPAGDARPWLIATARNLLIAEWRRDTHERSAIEQLKPPDAAPSPSLGLDDPALESALRELSFNDREALILVAWEELTPAEAARSLGISPTAFRVRLHRARRRLRLALADAQREPPLNASPRSLIRSQGVTHE